MQGYLHQPGSDCESENQRRAKERKLRPPPVSQGNYPGVLSSVWGFLPPRGSSGQSGNLDHPEHEENEKSLYFCTSWGLFRPNSGGILMPDAAVGHGRISFPK